MRGRDLLRQMSRRSKADKLDARLRAFYRARRTAVPKQGWLREIRKVTGRRAIEIAQAMETSEKTVYQLERSEVKGTISLKMLQKAAEGMRCDVVYAVVPWKRTE